MKSKTRGYFRMFFEDVNVSQENFEIMQPIVVVSRFFGLFPIKYIKYGTQYKLRWSIGYGIYSYTLSIILTIITLIGVVSDLQQDETHSIRMKDKKGRYVTCCDISIVIVIILFNTASLPFKLKKFWQLLRYLSRVDTIIPVRGQERLRKVSIRFISAMFAILLLLLSFDMALWAWNTKKPKLFFKNYFSFYMLYCILLMQEVFFWHIIFFVKIRISFLNRTLLDMESERVDRFYSKIFVQPCSVKAKRGGVKQDYGKQQSERGGLDKLNIVDKVVALIKFQEVISAAVVSVNNCVAYGVPLIMLSCLLHLIVTPYFLLTEIMKNGSIFFIALQSAWLLVHIGRVLIIVEPCQSCLNEHQRTAVIVYDLLTCHFDEEEKKALMAFAMQLSYCKIKFTSAGFFKIDRSLLTSMAGAVTTYLVILFQFKD